MNVGASVKKISATGDGNSVLISSDIDAQMKFVNGQSFEVKHRKFYRVNLALISIRT